MIPRAFVCCLFLIASAEAGLAQRRTPTAGEPQSKRTLTILTEPGAVVWLDDVRRGTTDTTGKLGLDSVSAGGHSLRVRANGFKESAMPITAAERGEVRVRLVRTTD